MNRRAFVRSGIVGGALLSSLASGSAVTAARSRFQDSTASFASPEARLAQQLASTLNADTLGELYEEAARNWPHGLPSLSQLQTKMSLDFRADRTVMLRRVRLSRTEAAWLLMQRET